ncbi:MAG: oxidoreductase [Gammaproteobacteria bacterium HGW-Gammaproteobacteria-3]|jgi:uncharacterized protein (DUF934 family)|nr:MAG: oxidoreductase [Gammaproteobacteria bacterium HGW-Gammaproteobacteria-3]
MRIIKDKQIVEDNWHFVADDTELPVGDITVSTARWRRDKPVLLKREGNIGLRIDSTEAVEDIAEDLPYFRLIELNFSTFTDGRSFTQASLLRSRFKFSGELRAVGNFMVDQIFYLSRTGVNAFALKNSDQLPVALANLYDFSVAYQASATG